MKSTTTRTITNDDVNDDPDDYVCFGGIDPDAPECRTCGHLQPCLSKSSLAGTILIWDEGREP